MLFYHSYHFYPDIINRILLLCILLLKLTSGRKMPVDQENGSTIAFETSSMPQSVFFLSLTGNVAQTNDPVRTRYPDSLSPSWLDNPTVKTHGEPVHQVLVPRYPAEQPENPLQISAQHSSVTANLSTSVNTNKSSS